tara:strand:+ start:256 stop:876 length:621 start_codon:yes stop_codon:yes gene_type:complete
MTLPSSGAISINSLVGEYGGSAPHALSEYYKGGGLVLNHANNANVPTSGTIDLADFYGQSNTNPAVTQYNYTMTCGGGTPVGDTGFDTAGATHGTSPQNFGSLSNNPQSGSTFASGFNPTIVSWQTVLAGGKAPTTSLIFEVAGAFANSGWTSLFMSSSVIFSGTAQTMTRASASYTQLGSNTVWRWNNVIFAFGNGQSGTVSINA